MIQVFLVKRFKRKNQRNGKREYRWALRWEGPGGWRCESTGTADRTQAEALQKQKWAELNIPEARPEEPAPEPVKASWDECKEALKRAMEADNLRPSYVHDSVWMLGVFRRMFPEAKTPADVTPAMANEYKRRRAEAEVSPWSIKGDLATLKAVFGKWLGQECGLLMSNPFVNVKPPKCDDPDVRIVTAEESDSTFQMVWGSLEQLAAAPCLFGSRGSLGLAGHRNGQSSGGRLACGWIRAGGRRELQDPAAQVWVASTQVVRRCASLRSQWLGIWPILGRTAPIADPVEATTTPCEESS